VFAQRPGLTAHAAGRLRGWCQAAAQALRARHRAEDLWAWGERAPASDARTVLRIIVAASGLNKRPEADNDRIWCVPDEIVNPGHSR
jgi:hypothetical protein